MHGTNRDGGQMSISLSGARQALDKGVGRRRAADVTAGAHRAVTLGKSRDGTGFLEIAFLKMCVRVASAHMHVHTPRACAVPLAVH